MKIQNNPFELNALFSLEEILETVSANCYIKDKHGVYLYANNRMLLESKLHAVSNIIGKTDQELWWGMKEILQMVENDKKIIYHNKSESFIENVKDSERKLKRYFSKKAPFHNKSGNVIGICGFSIPIDKDEPFNASTKEKNNAALTKRHIDCLYYLILGMTIKQIGRKLELSPRTIEHYLETIKMKLDCNNRTELVSKALLLPEVRERLLYSTFNEKI